MKDFVLGVGRIIIDFIAAAYFVIIICTGCFFLPNEDLRWVGLIILLFGIPFEILMFYWLYLFVDMRDSLKELVRKKINVYNSLNTNKEDELPGLWKTETKEENEEKIIKGCIVVSIITAITVCIIVFSPMVAK